MSDAVNKIRHDYTATKQSGTRPRSAIKLIVIHDAEVDDATEGAEDVGSFFASRAATGSTHFGVDNNTTQRYLNDNVVPWGAPGANTDGIHIELMGRASHTRDEWLKHHGPMFDRAGWLVAHLSKEYDIPLRVLTAEDVRRGRSGVVTHATITASHIAPGSHTDPGPHFPMDVLMSKAKGYTSLPQYRVTANPTRLRVKPSLTARTVAVVPHGRIVTGAGPKKLGLGAYFIPCIYNGKAGFINARHLAPFERG